MMSPAPLAKSPNQLQGRKEIRPEDVVKPDLLSQILLVGSGAISNTRDPVGDHGCRTHTRSCVVIARVTRGLRILRADSLGSDLGSWSLNSALIVCRRKTRPPPALPERPAAPETFSVAARRCSYLLGVRRY
jgi:hypothetical protein